MTTGVPYSLPWIAARLREMGESLDTIAIVGRAPHMENVALRDTKSELARCAEALERIERDVEESCPDCKGTGKFGPAPDWLLALRTGGAFGGAQQGCLPCNGTGLVRVAYQNVRAQLQRVKKEKHDLRAALLLVLEEHGE